MKNQISLINKRNQNESILFEQYKLMAEGAEHVTDKRLAMNNFYLAANSFTLAVASYLAITQKLKIVSIVVSIVGLIICVAWWRNIDSFKKLNSAKFKVIHELEKHLPARIYAIEDKYLKQKYYRLTSVEKTTPFIFGCLYVCALVLSLVF